MFARFGRAKRSGPEGLSSTHVIHLEVALIPLNPVESIVITSCHFVGARSRRAFIGLDYPDDADGTAFLSVST
jgi:hypothetical protein